MHHLNEKKQKALNELAEVDYEEVMRLKSDALQQLYAAADPAGHRGAAFLEGGQDLRAGLGVERALVDFDEVAVAHAPCSAW